MARNILREIKRLKCHRNFSTSTVLRNNEEFVVKSTLPDIIVPQARLFDYMLKESASFKNHIALVSLLLLLCFQYIEFRV